MKVIDSGHVYKLDSLDGTLSQHLIFVKREGPGFPGNVGHHPGTTLQEVMRAMVDRVEYLQNQIACDENVAILTYLRWSIWLLENRAARRHGRDLTHVPFREIVDGVGKCMRCGHVGCLGDCHAKNTSH